MATEIHIRLLLELFTLIALLSLISNILTIFLICKHKKLRCNATNIIILNINLVQMLVFCSSPLILRIWIDFPYLLYTYWDDDIVMSFFFCTLNTIELVLMSSLCIFLILLVCDWYFKVYKKGNYSKFCNVYKFFIVFIYLIIIFCSFLTTQFCFRIEEPTFLPIIILYVSLLFYVIMAVFLIAMNIVHWFKIRVETRPNEPGLPLGNIFILVWVPFVIYFLFEIYGIRYVILRVVCTTFVFTSPIFSFLYLFFYCNDYNMFLKRLVGRNL